MQRRYIVWVDADGNTRLTLINTLLGAGSVQAAMVALSEADVLNWEDGTLTVNGSPAAAGGTYRNVGDSAALTYTDAAGNLVVVQLPAPSSSVFLSDQETVDPVAIATLTAAIVGTVLTAAGGLVTGYVGGVRRRTAKESY